MATNGASHAASLPATSGRGQADAKRPPAPRGLANALLAAIVESSDDAIASKTLDGIAARVQGLATSPAILASGAVVGHRRAAELLAAGGLKPVGQPRSLRGIGDELTVYEIP